MGEGVVLVIPNRWDGFIEHVLYKNIVYSLRDMHKMCGI